ncbi:VOC family protein [Carboxylicivirga sp. N1Y90]|uniref:VOC family protein n=1 Tax=Carboxylicivirga fragile TaxID=3417571 RepID=UPI003D32B157|nr:hypothetical protein [Marinilabiliaceae bacterium N1Y90]
MDLKQNMVAWFEIPVQDLDRATRFYEEVFDITLLPQDLGPVKMSFFPYNDDLPGSPGGLMYYPEEYQVSKDGVLIYFSSLAGDLNTELSRVEKAGGQILSSKRLISEEIGYMAVFIDSEGNRIALYNKA